jgi:hypothetical protein
MSGVADVGLRGLFGYTSQLINPRRETPTANDSNRIVRMPDFLVRGLLILSLLMPSDGQALDIVAMLRGTSGLLPRRQGASGS